MKLDMYTVIADVFSQSTKGSIAYARESPGDYLTGVIGDSYSIGVEKKKKLRIPDGDCVVSGVYVKREVNVWSQENVK